MTGAKFQIRWLNALIVTSCLIIGILLFSLLRRNPTLPYRDSFARGSANEWVPQGGIWEIRDGAIFNRSDERIAKLFSGSSKWKDYEIDADIKHIGHEGDIGVIVRVGLDERGYDNYSGYYVGLGLEDSSLLIARSDHGWMEGQPTPVLGGVQVGKWYHLHVVAFQCQIGVKVTNLETGQSSWAAFHDQYCFREGKIGLRSGGTGGAWRNISVNTTTEQAWQDIRKHTDFITQPDFPGREANFARIRERYFTGTYFPVRSYRDIQYAQSIGAFPHSNTPQTVSIQSVRKPPLGSDAVIIRGVVTLTSPLYIQDSTGGIAIQSDVPNELNLGDEVEFSGKTIVNGFTPTFGAAGFHLLWDRTLVPPVSITSTQAASGAFDSSLVELSGILASKTNSRNVITLRLYDAAQTFTVVIHSGLSMQFYDQWELGSTMRVRGICTIPPSPSNMPSAFTILSRSINDVQVLSDPPWWVGWRLARLICLTVLLVCGGVYFYILLARWKMNTIVNERERLAHDLHDTLAQSFAGIGFHLQGLYNGMRTGNTRPEDAVGMLQGACDMVAHSHREASACIAALHPDADNGQDFLVALERSTRELLHSSRIEIALPLNFSREGIPQPLSMPVRDALFHIGREAISNMIRHAQATEMIVKLRYEAKEVLLEVRDNGLGFTSTQQSNGFGIRGMRSRCAKIGAQMQIVGTPGLGTVLTVHAPYGRQPRLTDWLRSLKRRIVNQST